LGAVAANLLHGRRVPRLPEEVVEWLRRAPTLPSDLVAPVNDAYRLNPDQFLADLYAGLVLPSHRRRLGTFFTPPSEVELMLNMWDEHAETPDRVVDVGAGVGVFTAAAAKRWPAAQVQAVDINPVTLGLLAARLYGPGQDYDNVALICDDFTRWFSQEDIAGATLILGNPPYTRAQLLPVEERRRLQGLTMGLCGSRASLSTVITAMALLRLGADDGLCLLLPAQWLESDYARELRSTIWASARRHVELRLVESTLFDDALVDAVALLVGPETTVPRFVLALWDELTPQTLSRDGIENPPSWRPLFTEHRRKSALTPGATSGHEASELALTLGEIARAKRGVATGANSYFALAGHERSDRKIGRWSKRRIVTRLRGIATDELSVARDQPDAAKRWILEARPNQVAAHPALHGYITEGEALGVHERVLCERRRNWYDLTDEVVVPDVIIGPMSRDKFRFVRNDLRASITNNLYGLVWDKRIPEPDREAVLAWLRSAAGQEALSRIARRQGDGLKKIEPRALNRLRLPDDIATRLETALTAPQ
jgi:SAM-dependent methyltransferase